MCAKSAKQSPFRVHLVDDELTIFDLADSLGPDKCLHRLLHLAISYGCKSIVEEEGVTVSDFAAEYKGFYKNFFRRIPQTLTRLHFFKKRITVQDISARNEENLQKHYIGFCTLRPFKKSRIVEASLPPLPNADSSSKTSFPLCLASTKVRLGGSRGPELLGKRAFPFMQQDGSFDCCGHVALRSMNKLLTQSGHTKDMGIEEIVSLARSVPMAKRDAPTEGLSMDEIATVFKGMGLDIQSYVYDEKSRPFWPPDRLVYHYVESGLPVLLGIPAGGSGHALVVLGHTFDPDEWWSHAETSYYNLPHSGGCYHCSTTWVSEFIVSDDNFGPYMTLPKAYLIDAANANRLAVIVALPKSIVFRGEEAEVYAHASVGDETFREATKDLPKASSSFKWARRFWHAYNEKEIVLRTLLMPSDELKKAYASEDYPTEFKNHIRRTKLPRFVWVTEFSTRYLFSQHRKLLGQFVTDSTTTPLFDEPAHLIVRLPGHLLVRSADDTNHQFTWEDDYPRRHLFRN